MLECIIGAIGVVVCMFCFLWLLFKLIERDLHVLAFAILGIICVIIISYCMYQDKKEKAKCVKKETNLVEWDVKKR